MKKHLRSCRGLTNLATETPSGYPISSALSLQLLEAVRAARAPFLDNERECSPTALAAALRRAGYIAQLRSTKPRECGKACTRTCLEKLQHTYVLVTGSLDSAITVRRVKYLLQNARFPTALHSVLVYLNSILTFQGRTPFPLRVQHCVHPATGCAKPW